ncbi:MAG: CehA/McbA family metallohydrolase [Acidobacteria bacterium]|nr:CehA/McbA family metallohydrolase [Acidobacteriota bacterium]MCI0721512.1 CehA/McbA family metallohydrolase [Acidobacteriota bacterium]
MRQLVLFSILASFLAYAAQATREPSPGNSRVRITIRTENGKSTGLRLRVTNSAGEYFAPLGHLTKADRQVRSAGDLILGDGQNSPLELHALVYDGAEIDLPPGQYTFLARKGYEYKTIQKEVQISPEGQQSVALTLRKFADFEAKGWYPGDTHLHFPDPQGVRYEMECEGLRVCSLLLLKSGFKDPPRPGDGHFWNVEHFTGKLSPVSNSEHVIKVGEEFRHGLLAHLIFQNLKSIVWPVSTGGLRESGAGGYDWPLMFHASGDARSQGAVVTWAHWPYPSLEAPLDIALGQIDSLDLLTTGSPFEHHPELVEIYKMQGASVYSMPPIEVYYHYLNCGFRLAASSGSDKMGLNPPIGSARTYVKTQGPLSYDSWVDGIRKGRTFITNYPLLEFSVNGKEPGDSLSIQPGKAQLSVRARAVSLEPYQALEILYNGEVIRKVRPSGENHQSVLDETIDVERGGWIAARAHGPKMLEYGRTWWRMPVFAHTSPIYIDMGGRAAPAAESARLFLEQLGYLQRWVESQAKLPKAENKKEALSLIAQAEAIYQNLVDRERRTRAR